MVAQHRPPRNTARRACPPLRDVTDMTDMDRTDMVTDMDREGRMETALESVTEGDAHHDL